MMKNATSEFESAAEKIMTAEQFKTWASHRSERHHKGSKEKK
jgi:hypothetical protein